MEELTYRITTLGCRVNRADSIELEGELLERGYRPAAEGEIPGLWIVNTCAVTADGLRKSRKAVRRSVRSGARVVVTGCAVGLEPSFLEDDHGIVAVLPNERKPDLASLVAGERRCARLDPGRSPTGIVRVPVKVQDGCRRFCTYCVVPFMRGEPYSRPASWVVRRVSLLRGRGVGEVILCGIDLGSYIDPETGGGLCSLARTVSGSSGDVRVRLSSLDISDISEDLLSLMNDSANLCRHLHIPLQSGDGEVLVRMGRRYRPDYFAKRIQEIRDRVHGVAVSTDVMVGFPAETEEAFQNTKKAIERISFSRIHVFKYSPRPGTAAFAMGDPIREEVKEERAAELRKIGRRTAERFHAGLLKRIMPVLVEETVEGRPGQLFGRSEHFVAVSMKGGPELVGSLVSVRVTSAGPDGVSGEIVSRHGR